MVLSRPRKVAGVDSHSTFGGGDGKQSCAACWSNHLKQRFASSRSGSNDAVCPSLLVAPSSQSKLPPPAHPRKQCPPIVSGLQQRQHTQSVHKQTPTTAPTRVSRRLQMVCIHAHLQVSTRTPVSAKTRSEACKAIVCQADRAVVSHVTQTRR